MKELFIKRFLYYKELGDKSFAQLSDEQMFWQYNEESNSIAVIVKHIGGNMLSRWTNFWKEDGEKPWRNRDMEFVNTFKNKTEILDYWEKRWACLFEALNEITPENINYTIFIRHEPHSVLDALLRQLAHYPYHIGQIIYIAKMLKNDDWKTLSIARNASDAYTIEMLRLQHPDEISENSSPVCFANSPEIRKDFKI